MFTAFINAIFLLASMALASSENDAVVGIQAQNAWKYGTGGGIIGLIVLVIDIVIFLEVFQSSRPPANKLIWTVLVFFFPVLGAILYYLFSEREKHRAGGGYEQIV